MATSRSVYLYIVKIKIEINEGKVK